MWKLALIAIVVAVIFGIPSYILLLKSQKSITDKQPQESTGFRVSGGHNIMKGNMAVNDTVAFDIKGGNNILENNLSVGIVKEQ